MYCSLKCELFIKCELCTLHYTLCVLLRVTPAPQVVGVGGRLLLHCYGGLGRTCLVAAAFLLGLDPGLAPEVSWPRLGAPRRLAASIQTDSHKETYRLRKPSANIPPQAAIALLRAVRGPRAVQTVRQYNMIMEYRWQLEYGCEHVYGCKQEYRGVGCVHENRCE